MSSKLAHAVHMDVLVLTHARAASDLGEQERLLRQQYDDLTIKQDPSVSYREILSNIHRRFLHYVHPRQTSTRP